jgi:hypothetical protein
VRRASLPSLSVLAVAPFSLMLSRQQLLEARVCSAGAAESITRSWAPW